MAAHRLLWIGMMVPLALPAMAATDAATGANNLYPAVVIDKATLTYTDDGRGGIAQCRTIVSTGSVRRDTRACDALRNRGTPRDVTPAMPIAGEPLVRPGDYPELSIKRRESGIAEAIIEVDETGKVSGCWVSYSSGSPRLDQQSCHLLLTRTRYSPATYKGKPVRAVGMREVAWTAQPKR